MSHYHHHRSDGPSRSSASPIIKDILRGALNVLTEPSSTSSSRHRSRDAYDPDRDYPSPPRRSATQPEPWRNRGRDDYTGATSHTEHSSGSGADELKEMLSKAAVELSRLVSGFEGHLRERRDTATDSRRPPIIVDAGPRQFRSDEDRFEVLSDDETGGGEDMTERERRRRDRRTRERRREESLPGGRERGVRNYRDHDGYGAQASHEPQLHPYTAENPDYYSYPATDIYPTSGASVRPKLKRSSTSASQALRRAGTDLLQNLPALLERAGWLVRVLEAQQKRTRKRSLVSRSGALIMALNLVGGLYRQYNERRSLRRDGGEHRERRALRDRETR